MKKMHMYKVFYYHRIKVPSEKELLHSRILKYAFCVDPDTFEKQIKKIITTHKIMSIDDLLNNDIPEKGVILTFDDGYKDIYTNIFPILNKYGIPAIVFLVTDFIGTNKLFWWDEVIDLVIKTKAASFENYNLTNDKHKLRLMQGVLSRFYLLNNEEKESYLEYMRKKLGCSGTAGENLSWGDVREMRQRGVYFGSHTMTHPALTRISLEEARIEILNSKIKIEQETGEEVKAFSYPHGAYDKEIKDFVKESGYRCAFTVKNRANHIGDDLFELGRSICL